MPVLDQATLASGKQSALIEFSKNVRPFTHLWFTPPLDELISPEYRQAYLALDLEVDKSIHASSFLSAEDHFAALRSQLDEVGDFESPVSPSVARTFTILAALRNESFAPSRLVRLRDEPGVGLTFHHGSRRAELEVLDDGGAFLTMYDREGPINVTEPALDRDLLPTLSRICEFLAQ